MEKQKKNTQNSRQKLKFFGIFEILLCEKEGQRRSLLYALFIPIVHWSSACNTPQPKCSKVFELQQSNQATYFVNEATPSDLLLLVNKDMT